MADGSISGNSEEADEESEEMTWFYFSTSPTCFPSPPPDCPPSPPLEFPPSPPPPSSDSRPVLPLAFDGSQPPIENPHQFTTNSLPLLPPPPQNQQQVISPAPQHQDNVSKQYLLVIGTVADTAVSAALEQLLEYWINTLRFRRRGRIMVTNSCASEAVWEAVWAALRHAAVWAFVRHVAVSASELASISAAVQAKSATVRPAEPVAIRPAVPPKVGRAIWAAESAAEAAVQAVERAAIWEAELAAVSAAVLEVVSLRAIDSAAVQAAKLVRVAVREAVRAAESAAESAALPAVVPAALRAAFLCLLECWTDVLNCTRRMMMNNSRGEQSIPIPREGLNIVVRQRHGGDRVTEIRRPRHRLCTFDNAEEVALAFDQAGFKLRAENARLNFPNLVLDLNRAAESTAPPRMEFPPPPAQQRNLEEDPGSGRSEAMAEAVDNEVEGLGWGSETGEGVRRKILERENKKTCGVRITIPLEDILKYSEMSLVDAAKKLNVSRSTLKRVCRDYEIPRWPPRSKIIRQNPQLNSNYLQLGPSNQASSSSTVVHTNPPQLSCAEKQPDTEMRLSSFKQPNDENIITVKARYVNNLTIKFPIPWPSSGLVELEQQVAKRLNLEVGTYHIKYKDKEDELILIACNEDFQNYVCDARLKCTSSITVFLQPKQPINYPSNNSNLVN